MADYVLDSSAVLASWKNELGAAFVDDRVAKSIISAVNLAEVVSVLVRGGMPADEVGEAVRSMDFEVVDADEALALDAGFLYARTKAAGLSLGDRFCIALARRENLPVLTSDRAWLGLDVGVKIEAIR